VARVQFLLGVDSDGYFGNTTHNALLDFQFARGLKPTGIVDERTWYELDRSQLGPGVDLNSDGLVTPDEFR
jgi:peptidoglycan hydrolase-like protein with peptidoglycan-binding domain